MLDNIFMQVIDMSKAASLVILGVILIRLLLKKAPKVYSYALWTVVLFRLLCPVSIEAPVSVMPQMPSVSEGYSLSEESISFVGASVAAYRAVGDAMNGGLGVQRIPTTDTDADGNVHYASSAWWEVWVLFGQYVWLAGMAGMGLYSLVSYFRLKGRLRESVAMGENIFLADRIDSPFVMGLLHPNIYLPSSLPEQERSYIIAHEQYHIHRRDHVVKLIAFAALCVHWFNPLVWLAFILSGKDMEMSCDEAVIKKLGESIRADYSASLLNLSMGHRIISGTPLAFGEGDTGSRIRNLAKWKKPALWVSVIAVIAVIAAGVVLLTDPAEKEPQTKPIPAVEPEPGAVYVSYECLYMNPLSSYLNDGDSGCRYHIHEDSFTIENRMYGFSSEFENITWEWTPYHEAGKELDALFENSRFYQFGPLEQDVLYQPISDDYFLIQKDGTLLIYEVRSVNKLGRQIWSIYSLVPESYMGSAQWEFEPTSSANLPLFRFEFGIDCTDISAVCTESSVSMYLDPELGGNKTISWSPVNENGEIVTDAKISFTLLGGDMPVANGAIYITGEPSGNLGGYTYTARIVGTGLHLSQSSDGGIITPLTAQTDEGSWSFSLNDFSAITSVTLTNCHNGRSTLISDAVSVNEIIQFMQGVSGTDMESGKGYYEGTYSLQFYSGESNGDAQIFTYFGDDDVFYYGDFGDGYPGRYHMTDMTKADIVAFFSQYDTSGFVWE